MSLSSADRLGPYEIVSRLGAGAMGEVYRARDTRLRREVALKVIAEEVAQDPSRLLRFEREARAVAALNHPNIVSLYDFGNAEGTAYMVTELIDGKTLRTVLARGRMSLRQILDISAQIADGLTAAHAAGITHRDLKPENIMLTREGRVKILDFGIARYSAAEGTRSESTVLLGETAPGTVLGTAHYMSPEQVQGETLDYRSDQFSFGSMLYEMLAGRRAFERSNSIQTMCAIVNEDAPRLEESVPVPLSWIVQRCLQKDARNRYASTQDLAHGLHDLSDHIAHNGEMPIVEPGARRWKPSVLAVIAAVFAALALALVALPRRGPINLSDLKFTPFAMDPGGQCCAVWSRDGNAVAYITSPDDKPALHVRYLNALMPRRLPDVSHLVAQGGIAAWPTGSKIIAASEAGKDIEFWNVPTLGKDAEPIDAPRVGKWFAVAPDGRTGASYMKRDNDKQFTLWYFSLPGHELRRYSPSPFATERLESVATLAFSPDGHKLLLMFYGDGKRQAWMIPWPQGSGVPKQILYQLDPVVESYAQFSWMPDWMPDNRHIVLAPVAGSTYSRNHLYMADTESKWISQITSGTGSEIWPSVSPEGTKLIFEERDSDLNIASVSLPDGKVSSVIATSSLESMPAWSRQENRLVYVLDRNGTPEIWARDANGSTHPLIPAGQLPPGCMNPVNPSLSPDAQRIIYACRQKGQGFRLWIASAEGGPSPVQLTSAETPSGEQLGGSWSPDGKWFAYLDYSAAQPRLMKVSTNGEQTPALIRETFYSLPDWSPDGKWISYRQGGWYLVSPDGQHTRMLGDLRTRHVAFSQDSKRIWFIPEQAAKVQLAFFDLETNRETVVADLGLANRPASDYNNAFIRFSVSPDGRSLVYAAARNNKRNLWMLEGFPQWPFGGIFR